MSQVTLDEKPRLWDAKEVAEFLGASRAWVYGRAEAGLLPHLRIGNLIRFEPDVLKAFVRQDRVSATYSLAKLQGRLPAKPTTL